MELSLGQPRGIVPIRMVNGVADMTIRRRPDTAVQLVVRGGASHVRLDDRFALVVQDGECWQTPSYAAASDRYEITVENGASNLKVVKDA